MNARATLDDAMTEKQLQQAVTDLAQLLGWLVYHVHDSRRSAHGFPDLILLRDGHLLVIELKTSSGRLTAAQQTWLAHFTDLARTSPANISVHLWRPTAWSDGTIEAVLR